MPLDISLLPKEVEKKKAGEAREQFLRRLAVIFLGVSFFIGGGVSLYNRLLLSEKARLEKTSADETSKINSLREIETKALDLEERSKALSEIFKNTLYFSVLLGKVASATSADVTVTELTAPSGDTAAIAGTSRSYSALAKFLLALKNPEEKGGLFEVLELRSVSLDQQTGQANFNLSVKIAKGGLRQ